MKRRLLALGAVVVAMMAAGCGPAGGMVNAELPDVQLEPYADEAAISLAAVERPAVINIWATTCVPCIEELPEFQAVSESRSDITFYGINRGEDAEQISEFFAEHNIELTYPQYLDIEGRVASELSISAMPTTIIVDAQGNVAHRSRGTMDTADLNSAIDSAIAGKGSSG